MSEGFLRKNQKMIFIIIGIPVLLTFSITTGVNEFFDRYFGSGGDLRRAGSFSLPSGQKIEVDEATYNDFARNLTLVEGSGGGEEAVWDFMMLYHAAREAGVHAPMSQVKDAIRQTFRDEETYATFLRQAQLTGQRQMYEEKFLQRYLVVANFRRMLMGSMAVPDGSKIVEQWQKENEEYKLEYLTVSVDQLREEMEADAVTDDTLREYFDGLTDAERNRKYREQEKVALEGVTMVISEAKLEKYESLLDGVEFTEADFRRYYQQNRVYRFARSEEEMKELREAYEEEKKKQEEEKGEGGEEAGDTKPPRPPSPYYTLEEVKDQVEREVMLKKAMEKLIDKAEEEAGKDGASWDSFADAWDLETFKIEEPKTRAEMVDLERFGTANLRNQAFVPEEFGLTKIVGVAKDDFFIYKISKKIPAGVPELDAIRDKVLGDYLDQEALKQAEARAKEIHTALVPAEEEKKEAKEEKNGEEKEDEEEEKPEAVPAAKFAEVAGGFDLEVGEIDFFSKSYRMKLDWMQEEDGPAKFLKGHNALFALDKGDVAEPITGKDKKSIYLARVADRRLPEADKMTPGDFDQISRRMKWLLRSQIGSDAFSHDSMKEFFQLEIDS